MSLILEVPADLLDFLGLKLVGHLELVLGVLRVDFDLRSWAATEPPIPPLPAYNSAGCLHGAPVL